MPLFRLGRSSAERPSSAAGQSASGSAAQQRSRPLTSTPIISANHETVSAVPNGGVDVASSAQSRLQGPSPHDRILRHFGPDGAWPVVPTKRKRRSRLMPSLDEMLHDQGPGACRRLFLQFLRTRSDSTAANQLHFWLDADSFRAVTKARLLARHCSSMSDERKKVTRSQELVTTCSSLGGGTPPTETAATLLSDAETSRCSQPPTPALPITGLHQKQQSISNGTQMAQKLWKSVEQDAVAIFTTYIAKDASSPIGVPDELRNEVTRKICDENGLVDPLCFQPAQEFVVNDLADKRYFQDFVHSVHHCKHQVDVLTSGSMTLEDVLYNEPSLFFFMEFVELEGQRDLLEFWLAADNFYGHLMEFGGEGKYDGIKAQEDAMVLYDRYFSLQATCSLGFSDAVRLEVEQNICREEGPTPACFERAIAIVLAVLERIYFEPFLESQLYVKYLNELVNAVRTTTTASDEQRSPASLRRRSDASESSAVLGNTLLAMDSTPAAVRAGASPLSSRRLSRRKFDGGDMRIDTGQFVPDALWRRKYAGKLTIGYVNDVGQFVSDLEPEPDKRQALESKLSKAVKRFVFQEDDKTKEDMALQVARMIIHEVLTVTLARKDDEPHHDPRFGHS